MNVLTIPSRFNGPAGVGNGGYVCGRIAAYVDGPATVTLRRPPPLDTPMEVERDGDGSVRVRHGRTLIGEAAPSPPARWRYRPRCRSPKPTRPPGGPDTSPIRCFPTASSAG